MKFATNFDRRPRKQEAFTNTKQKVYKTVYNEKTGKREQKVEKEIDIYEKIQEYRDEMNITNILKKYNLDMFRQMKDKEEQLVDITNLPTNLMQAQNIIRDAEYAFDRQSKEFKEKFNNSFKEFLAGAENGKLAQMLNKELKVSAERFNTNNMANYQGQDLKQYAPQIQQPTMQNQPQQVVQPTMQQPTQNIVTGGTINV